MVRFGRIGIAGSNGRSVVGESFSAKSSAKPDGRLGRIGGISLRKKNRGLYLSFSWLKIGESRMRVAGRLGRLGGVSLRMKIGCFETKRLELYLIGSIELICCCL